MVCDQTILAAVGVTGISEVGLVTMVIMLKAVDLPLEGISLLLVIDPKNGSWITKVCTSP